MAHNIHMNEKCDILTPIRATKMTTVTQGTRMGNPVPESPMEMARTIKKMVGSESIDEIAKKTRKPKEWIENTLSLLKLHHLIQGHVDDGGISLGNAYVLAHCNLMQQLWLQKKAQEMTIAAFADYVSKIDWEHPK